MIDYIYKEKDIAKVINQLSESIKYLQVLCFM